MSSQLATRVEDVEAARFRETTRLLGTTPADAMRIFVSAFNAHRGFPFDVRLPEPKVEAFASEQEAAEFSDRLALRMMDDARTFESSGIPTRVRVEPSAENGLERMSFVMTDKIASVSRGMLGKRIGVLERDRMDEVTEKLALVLGLS